MSPLEQLVRLAAEYDRTGRYDEADTIDRLIHGPRVSQRFATVPSTATPPATTAPVAGIAPTLTTPQAAGTTPAAATPAATTPSPASQNPGNPVAAQITQLRAYLDNLNSSVLNANVDAQTKQVMMLLSREAIDSLNAYNYAEQKEKAAKAFSAPGTAGNSASPTPAVDINSLYRRSHRSQTGGGQRTAIVVPASNPQSTAGQDNTGKSVGALALSTQQALVPLTQEATFPGGTQLYDAIKQRLDQINQVATGALPAAAWITQRKNELAAAGANTTGTASVTTPASSAINPATGFPNGQGAAAAPTGAGPNGGPNTTNPAAWAAYQGQYYNRTNHMMEYLNRAMAQGWDYNQLAQHLHQHEADMGFIKEVLARYNQEWGQRYDLQDQQRQYLDGIQAMANGGSMYMGADPNTGGYNQAAGGTVVGGPQGGYYPAMQGQIYPTMGPMTPAAGAYSGPGSGYGYGNWGQAPAPPATTPPLPENYRRP